MRDSLHFKVSSICWPERPVKKNTNRETSLKSKVITCELDRLKNTRKPQPSVGKNITVAYRKTDDSQNHVDFMTGAF